MPKNALSSKQWEDAVCLEHLVEAPLSHPREVEWVDSCVQTPPGVGEGARCLYWHTSLPGDAGGTWPRGISYSCMSSLIMCTSRLSIKRLFLSELSVSQVGWPEDTDASVKAGRWLRHTACCQHSVLLECSSI